MAFPESIDPSAPADSDIASAGPAVFRALKQIIIDVFGLPIAPSTITGAAMQIGSDGTPTLKVGALVSADPSAPLGIASKQYVDATVAARALTFATPGIGSFTTDGSTPVYTCYLIGGGGGGGAAVGAVNGPGGGGGSGAVAVCRLFGMGSIYSFTVGAGGAAANPGSAGSNGSPSLLAGLVTAGGGFGGAPGGINEAGVGGNGGTVTPPSLVIVSATILMAQLYGGGKGGNGSGNSGGAGGIGWPTPYAQGGMGGSNGGAGPVSGRGGAVIFIPGG